MRVGHAGSYPWASSKASGIPSPSLSGSSMRRPSWYSSRLGTPSPSRSPAASEPLSGSRAAALSTSSGMPSESVSTKARQPRSMDVSSLSFPAMSTGRNPASPPAPRQMDADVRKPASVSAGTPRMFPAPCAARISRERQWSAVKTHPVPSDRTPSRMEL